MEEKIRELHEWGGAEIVKASAGSGKTFTLAREYIRLLLQKKNVNSKDAHRHILAVTFTNKATGEMKSRIIKELDILARDPLRSDHREYLMQECGMESARELSQKAESALSSILNDYGGFSVSTIDRFFQQALRAFAREAGHVDEYQVELDKASLVSESVDRLLDSLSEGDRDLLKWLSESSISGLEMGDGYHLEKSLGDFAKEYTRDTYSYAEKENGIDRKAAFSEENLRSLTRICNEVRRSYENRLHALAKDLADHLDCCIGVNSYLAKYVARLQAYKDGEKLSPSAVWLRVLADGSAAFLKKGLQIYGQDEFDRVKALAMRIEYLDREKNTAEILRSQVALFRVADALDREFEALLKEKNVLSLDDTNKILHDIIGGTDAPFIYEKLGVRYNNFLLDEFQDTSRVQWENFRPLLANSISEACFNLIVGDVKQSIYRWRNADWSILDSGVERDLKTHFTHPLSGNHRSLGSIVDFNNAFFKTFAGKLDSRLEALGAKLPERRISDIYSDVCQNVCRKCGGCGGVSLTICGKEMTGNEVIATVKEAHDKRKYAYKDIYVIVRTNAEGADIASLLIGEGIPVVSNDSLRISSGRTVRIIVSQLYRLDNSHDRINTWYAPDEFDPASIRGCKSLTETVCRMLEDMDPEETDKDSLYVLAFLDLVRDFSSRNGNSLHSFLEFWSEEGIGRNISTPEGSDAVTVITIHKVKGLSAPVTIIPVPGKALLVPGREMSWECPDMSGTPFGAARKALYNVKLSDSLGNTFFRDGYAGKLHTIYVDAINLWYVAFTRAREEMHIISPAPSKEIKELSHGEWGNFKTVPDVIYLYARDSGAQVMTTEEDSTRFLFGELAPKAREEKAENAVGQFRLSYNGSVPLMRRGNLKIKSDADEFFSSDCRTGLRKRGIILHGIMQRIGTAEDLKKAVDNAVMSGLLSDEESSGVEDMLRAALESVSGRGWFSPGSGLRLDEREIADRDGRLYRPDRVLVDGDKATVIDYKFGEEDERYLRQIRKYASLYRSLGCREVRSYVWYVEKGKIVEG